MPISSRLYVNRSTPSNRFPVGLKWLLVVTIGISVLQILSRDTALGSFLQNFALVPAQVVQTFAIWQVVTYLFLHGGLSHVLWNMLALWMFGAAIERAWGTSRFLKFYFACGIIAAGTVILAAYLFGGTQIATVGASGAVYGILVAYGMEFPDQTILFGFLIPMKSKYFVMIIGAVIFLQSYMATVGGQGSSIAVVAHLGGMVGAFVLLRGNLIGSQRRRFSVRQPVMEAYKDFKLRRAKRKFEVYLRKKDSDRDRWVQ